MKKLFISAVMVLALACGSAFASPTQNKNASGTKSMSSSGMKKGTKKHTKRHRKATKKTANANS